MVRPRLSVCHLPEDTSGLDGFGLDTGAEDDGRSRLTCAFDGSVTDRGAEGDVTDRTEQSFTKIMSMRGVQCVFQFSTGVFYAEEEDGVVEVDVMRIGST